MDIQDQHTMDLVAEHSDGSQEWHCPTCGRRFVVYFEPDFKRVILEEGNFEAVHSGGTNGLSFGQVTIQPEEKPIPIDDIDYQGGTEMDDSYLAPFKAWMDNHTLL